MQFLAGSNNEELDRSMHLQEVNYPRLSPVSELIAQKLIHITVYISYYIIILPAVGIQILPG